jgi:hypothetical protein
VVGKGGFEPDASADVCSRPCRIGKGSFRRTVEPSAYANVRRLGCQIGCLGAGGSGPPGRTTLTSDPLHGSLLNSVCKALQLCL